MKNFFGNLLLLTLSLLAVFMLGEVASRYIMPISPGPSIKDLEGNKQTISYIEAGKEFIITTPDYAAKTSITKDGYRAPAAKGNPQVVFIGDSFTYAQGVTDEQAFPALYCKEKKLNCANLAVPGASTLYEVDRLELFLKERGWRPEMVHFFFFTGNDFSDNLDADAKRSKGLDYAPEETNLKRSNNEEQKLLSSVFDFGLKHSNLLRIAYFKVLPLLRNDPEESKRTQDKALQITQKEFKRLDTLSKQYGFDYQIYIIHSEPEIRNNVYDALDKQLQAIAEKPIISLAKLFKENTQDYFFPSDGHFSVAGNRKLADYLLSK